VQVEPLHRSQLRRRRPERRSVDSQPYSGMSKTAGSRATPKHPATRRPIVAEVHVNPTPEQLRAFTEEMPETRISEFGNTNTQTQVLSRSAASTHVVDRESSGKTMTRAQYDEIAALQDAYIAEHDMVQIDGYIGNDPEMRTAARLLMEKRYANIAGM